MHKWFGMETCVRSRYEDIRRCKDNIKTNFQLTELNLDWIDLTGDRGNERSFFNSFVYFGSIKRRKLLNNLRKRYRLKNDYSHGIS